MTTARERLWWTTVGSRRLALLAIALVVLARLALPSSAQDMVVSDLSLAVELQKQPDVARGEPTKEPDGLQTPPFDKRTSDLAGAVLLLGAIYLGFSRYLAHRAEMRRSELDLDKERLKAARDVLKDLRVHRDEKGELVRILEKLVDTVTGPETTPRKSKTSADTTTGNPK